MAHVTRFASTKEKLLRVESGLKCLLMSFLQKQIGNQITCQAAKN